MANGLEFFPRRNPVWKWHVDFVPALKVGKRAAPGTWEESSSEGTWGERVHWADKQVVSHRKEELKAPACGTEETPRWSVGSCVPGCIQGLPQGASPAAGSARQPDAPAAGARSWLGFNPKRNGGLVFSLLLLLYEIVTHHGWIESWAGFCTWCEVCRRSVLLSSLIPEGLSGSCFGCWGRHPESHRSPNLETANGRSKLLEGEE